MRNAHSRNLQVHRTSRGREPFTEWFESIQDRKTQNRIEARLNSIKYGNFGDCQSVGEGVFELRLHFGPGYRIYFSVVNNTIVLLLCGGDKTSQARDIVRAKTYWVEYKETHR
ncbi:MAG: type II toxin-antitoxin system RelE/ParE family toxin [Candidatus Poribacteria bacterium]|nr:type II toxin-antitoxin system RelE/ParE family toxin [Candidatus Poribacteria bacterium]